MSRYFRSAIWMVILSLPAGALAQQSAKNIPVHVRSSAAYAEVLLRTTEARAELESVTADYTDTNPRVLDMRYEIAELLKAGERLSAVSPADAGKLTVALGKLLVQKASLETDLARLLRNYTSAHPEARRAAKKVEIFNAAIRELLP